MAVGDKILGIEINDDSNRIAAQVFQLYEEKHEMLLFFILKQNFKILSLLKNYRYLKHWLKLRLKLIKTYSAS